MRTEESLYIFKS